MGVTHMLLVALMGITYGWQSDGRGGVEYIVQVSPSELKEIDRLGEISSVIDPSVAGHVSRIKIRIGTGSLPRETPSHFARTTQPQSGAGQAWSDSASDRAVMPIPEMVDRDRAVPIRGPSDTDEMKFAAAGRPSPKATAMMKPDPDNGAARPAFQFPETAGRAVDGLRNEVDQAGRNVSGFGKSAIDSLTNNFSSGQNNGRVPAPGTRSPDPNRQSAVPQFAGGNSASTRATTRAGGPSTDPTPTRDQSWNKFGGPRQNGPSTREVGTREVGTREVGTREVGSDNMRFTDPRTKINSAINTASTAGGSSNRGSGGSFGQSPVGLNFPTQQMPNDTFARDRILSQQQQMEIDRRNRSNQINTGQIAGRQNRTDLRNQFSGPERQESLFDRQRNAFDPTLNASNERESIDPRFQNGLRSQSESKATNDVDPRQQFADDATSSPDRRLTQAELQAGAHDIDRYGNLLNRNGRRISLPRQNTAPTPPVETVDNRYENSRPRTTLQQPLPGRSYADQNLRDREQVGYERAQYADPRNAPSQDRYQRTVAMENASRTDFARQSVDRNRPVDNRQIDTRQVSQEPESQSNRAAIGTSFASERPKTTPKHVAAQPLFNGLLLMSFVANIYMIFWLKNLRVRFRDMVAAKRVANVTAQPV